MRKYARSLGARVRLWYWSLRFALVGLEYHPISGAAVTPDTQTLALADSILKDLYVGPMVEQLNAKTYLIDQIERTSEHIDFAGRRAWIPLRIGRNVGRGSRGDNAALPQGGRQRTEEAIVPIRYHYIGIELTDPTIEATKKSEGAFVNAVELETDGAADDIRKDINRQCFGDGTGLLCTITTDPGSNVTQTVDSVQFIQDPVGGIGDPVDVITKASGAAVGTNPRTIVARVGGATKTITFDTAVDPTAANADGVYLAGSRNNEMDGLRNITSTSGTLHNIDKSTNSWWKGKEKDAATATIGESLFEQLADSVGAGGRGEVEVFLTSRGIRRRLADTYQSQKRFNDANAVEIHGGYSAIMVNETPVVSDDDCPVGFAFGINKKALKWYELAEPQWLEQGDGRILHLKDSSTPAQGKMNVWQGWFKWYAALATHAANRNGRIINGADDNPD